MVRNPFAIELCAKSSSLRKEPLLAGRWCLPTDQAETLLVVKTTMGVVVWFRRVSHFYDTSHMAFCEHYDGNGKDSGPQKDNTIR